MNNLSFIDKIIFFLNTIAALVLLISLLLPFTPATLTSSIAVLSIVVPITVIVNVAFLCYWLLRKKRNFLLSGVLILAWYIMLGPFYHFSNGVDQSTVENSRTVSIMTFNARSFNELEQIKEENIENRIYEFVLEKNPDIVCFQETLYAMKANDALSQYPYKFVDFIYGKHRGKVIQSIYSKYPILNIDSINFPKSYNNAIYADILIKNDTVRLYNLHLQSFRIVPGLNAIQNQESAKLLKRYKNVMLKQYQQAKLVRENMDDTKYTKLVVGDFNNTQYSNVYRLIQGDMIDSFLESGSGFGRTYDLWKLPLRIDYILADPDFEVVSHQNFDVKLSDHYPVMATLRLKPSHE
ncbi:endonuclease/exonuclease/phosphatase family protein [Allomuricauda sp.]|uniref:endonuclease/exonuclease/phosphatase family protein n=1 Tax=Flagellimonas alginolytica TaxID=3177515 RepID=UPI0025DAE246|nr:endonuclease/exonuclease/phosphatase family protein [Allomuricauda sp.]